MKKILTIVLAICSLKAIALIGDKGTESQKAEHNYCLEHGGSIVIMQAKYDTHDGLVTGKSKKFCRFNDRGTLAYVGLATLSQTPTLAATYTQKISIDMSKNLPNQPYSNPALNVCNKLHGSEIVFGTLGGGFTDGYGQADICIFGDGSAISAWSMIYAAIDPTFILHNIIRSNPLNIDIPQIQ